MQTDKAPSVEKKPYETPKLIRHGDVETITLGDDLGDDVDAAFTTSMGPLGKKKRKKQPQFS
ncbi:MAG: lasso RiPP family leader peptide-containing protein [Pyrinomonadaceae bacterium]